MYLSHVSRECHGNSDVNKNETTIRYQKTIVRKVNDLLEKVTSCHFTPLLLSTLLHLVSDQLSLISSQLPPTTLLVVGKSFDFRASFGVEESDLSLPGKNNTIRCQVYRGRGWFSIEFFLLRRIMFFNLVSLTATNSLQTFEKIPFNAS